MWQTKRFDELKATGQLPSPTGVALRVLEMAQSDGVGVAEVAQIVQGDPALAGRLLKLVNSAFYAGARAITAVSDAVARLGLRTTWQVALGFSVISGYSRGQCRHFDYDRFWSHCLATAVAAQLLGRNTRLAQPEEAFTCGLVGQIGRLALACIYPQTYSNLLRAARGHEAELLDLEQETFAMDHRELTAAILQDWGLAPLWVAGARYHEDPLDPDLLEGDPARKLALLMNTANGVGNVCVARPQDRARTQQELLARAARIRITEESLVPLCDLSAREWVNWGRLLGVKTRELPSFANMTDESSQTGAEAGEPIEPRAVRVADVRVLVVDEDPSTAELARRYLPTGALVQNVVTDQEGLRLALEFDPQIIIADWDADGLNGVELCRSLRRIKAGQHVYILLMTKVFDEELLAAALEAGANEHVVKPIVPRVLEARIKVALRMIGLQQEVLRDREEIRQHLAELAVLNRTLEQAALTDPLTGLPNRRYAIDRLREEWTASTRTGSPLSCMIVDLDYFKGVNDSYGHDVGDLVLCEVAGVLRRSLRATDVVCRIGGEEFLVICRDTDRRQSAIGAERLRKRVEDSVIAARNTELKITISIGVASRNQTTPDVDALIKQADRATYTSKTAGRNRVSLSTGN